MDGAVSTTSISEFPGEGVDLDTYAPAERPWNVHRRQAQQMTDLLQDSQDPRIRALRVRMLQCATHLIFAHTPPDKYNRTFKLHEANFCRVRACPVCEWRRSLRYAARFQKALPAIAAENPGHRWVLLTLTVKNSPITGLRAEITRFNLAWKRFAQSKKFRASVLGYVKSIEVTRSQKGEAHPHAHVLLLVSKEYFEPGSSLYLTHQEWREQWRKSARLGYDPQICVQAVPEEGCTGALREIVKYATKPEDLLTDRNWLIEYIKQVHNLRFLAVGGVVRKYFSLQEPEEEEMLAPEGETASDEVVALSRFDWDSARRGYFSVGTLLCACPPQPQGGLKHTANRGGRGTQGTRHPNCTT